MAWKVRGSDPGGSEFFFRTHPDQSKGLLTLLYNGYRVFLPGAKVPDRCADHQPPSAPEENTGKATRPSHSWAYSACIGTTFTHTRHTVHVVLLPMSTAVNVDKATCKQFNRVIMTRNANLFLQENEKFCFCL